MTLNEAIARASDYSGDDTQRAVMVTAVNSLEAMLSREVHSRYAETADKKDIRYDIDKDGGTELSVSAPYDDMYPHFIAAEVFLRLHEQKSYNNHLNIFNTLLDGYKRYLNRTYRPLGISKYRVR